MRITARKSNHQRVNRFKEVYYSFPSQTGMMISTSINNGVRISTYATEGNQEVNVSLNQAECIALLDVINASLNGKDLDVYIDNSKG